jgi:hypothetical protein
MVSIFSLLIFINALFTSCLLPWFQDLGALGHVALEENNIKIINIFSGGCPFPYLIVGSSTPMCCMSSD